MRPEHFKKLWKSKSGKLLKQGEELLFTREPGELFEDHRDVFIRWSSDENASSKILCVVDKRRENSNKYDKQQDCGMK